MKCFAGLIIALEKPWLDDRVQHALHWDGYDKAHHKSDGRKEIEICHIELDDPVECGWS